MKFFYILNKNNKLVEFGKISSERFISLELITESILYTPFLELTSFSININKVEKKIIKLLTERNSNPLNISDYEGAFLENEIFEIKQFKEEKLKLCTSGFDNLIIFFINIYNSLLVNEEPYFLLFANNNSEFNNWYENNKSIQTNSNLENRLTSGNNKVSSFVLFDGMKSHNVINQYDDWLSSTDYSIWSNSYVEILNKRIYIIKENVKVLSTFRYFGKEELELISKKYDLKIKEENGVSYAYTDNHSTRQLEISENDKLIVIYCLEGGNMPESIFIYGVFEK
jgi:hypothetical protein